MKNNEEIITRLREEAKELDIPQSLAPEQMQKKIKLQQAQKTAEQQKRGYFYRNMLAVAACICLICGLMLAAMQQELVEGQEDVVAEDIRLEEQQILEIAEQGIDYPKIAYEDIYASMEKTWEKSNRLLRGDMPAADMAEGVVTESAAEEESAVSDAMNVMEDKQSIEFGTTNVQTTGVEEGDIAKNDGRYLYQKIQVEEDNLTKWEIQIIDTQDGLKEISRIDGFNSIEEFYVWEDVLVVIESKYLDTSTETTNGGMIACYDVAYFENYYHEISFYNIGDRSRPIKIKTFTLQGNYASSRISDGYFYGFSKYYANPGEGKEDYDSYIPTVDGIRLQASKLYLPEGSDATTYLVMVAINLKNPTKFTDTTGIVAGADLYYVSTENIYVADEKSTETKEGWNSNITELLKFSYGEGKFALRAMGEVKGELEGSFSLDEYQDNLRVVSTVLEYYEEKVIDDRTGEVIGYSTTADRQTNALYVLDKNLDMVGKIEGLAEDEQIYSARFMGDTGYFVTFRQTDPLFTVDLKDPENPEILSELKVSGFSEYLHIYGEDRLLGIGMEADEETGVQQGMKLSMFDVSDKSDVKEVSKLHLEDYNYSEALYNHRAVMISNGKNIFGFEAEGSNRGEYSRKYFVFSYENDAFVQKLKINVKSEDGGYYTVRGTFIGDVFYLLGQDGSVRSYDLNTGKQLESLKP